MSAKKVLKNCGHSLSGVLNIKESEINLELTLLGGQSFRWRKLNTESPFTWCGVAYNTYWQLTQNATGVNFVASPATETPAVKPLQLKEEINVQPKIKQDPEYYKKLLAQYFHSNFDLSKHYNLWRKSHRHFAEIAPKMKAVRILAQEPFENIISFICSQNNHIKRISTMIQWLCKRYGRKIGHFHGADEYTFPTFSMLMEHRKDLDGELRAAKFGYRAKFIVGAIEHINEHGGIAWFDKLCILPYEKARLELVKLPGIGFKVADCICLMSLGHLQAVPVDTHIYKIAQTIYMPHLAKIKSVTPKIYEEITKHFQEVYGDYAGWAQTVLFCASLQQFREPKKSVYAKKKKTQN